MSGLGKAGSVFSMNELTGLQEEAEADMMQYEELGRDSMEGKET